MNAVGPWHQRIGQIIDGARGSSVAGQAQGSGAIVAHEEVQGNLVNVLHMRVVATFAGHISAKKPDTFQRIRSLVALYQTIHQIRRILQRVKAERMGVLQVGAQNIAGVHLALHLNLAVGHRLAWGNGSIMATQAKAAGASQRRLLHGLIGGCAAAVRRISLGGIGLCPKRSLANSRMRSVAVLAGRKRPALEWRLSAGRQIVRSENIASELCL